MKSATNFFSSNAALIEDISDTMMVIILSIFKLFIPLCFLWNEYSINRNFLNFKCIVIFYFSFVLCFFDLRISKHNVGIKTSREIRKQRKREKRRRIKQNKKSSISVEPMQNDFLIINFFFKNILFYSLILENIFKIYFYFNFYILSNCHSSFRYLFY